VDKKSAPERNMSDFVAPDPVQIEILRMFAKTSGAFTEDEFTILLNLRMYPNATKARLQQLCGMDDPEEFDFALEGLVEDDLVTVSDCYSLPQMVE
jgi:hypothetical protein